MKSKRMLHVDYMENGSRMVLDRDTNTLIPEWKAGLEESVMVWCKKCGNPYLSIREKCPYCGFTRQKEKIETELERAQKNVRRARGLDEPPKLTVGDLSIVNQAKRDHRVEEGQRRLANQKQGLTVGDLSWTTESKDSAEEERQRARAEKAGLTVGDRFVGRRVTPQPILSESQELIAEMQAEHRQKTEESIKIKNLMIAQEEEKQIRKDAAAIRIRQEREQVDREVDKLLRKGKARYG